MGFWRDLWFGPEVETRSADPDSPHGGIPQSDVAGSGVKPPTWEEQARAVTAERALGLDAVYRAVSIIATGVTQLSLDVERGGVQIDAPSWVREPDVNTGPERFLEETTTSLASNGNAFWKVERGPAGQVVNLSCLPPNDVAVSLDTATGVRTYGWAGRTWTKEIRHLGLLWLTGRARALGPIQAAQESLGGAVDLRDYASGWFRDSGVPSGLLSTDSPMSPEAAEAVRQRWEATQGGRRGTAVMTGGITYKPVLITPEEAQFIESQQFSVTSLARLFGIPANLMLAAVEGTSNTYSNVAQADLTFVRWTLSKYTREIESAFSALLPRGQRARFNLDALLRPDTLSRYQAHQVAIASGFLTVDEVRAIEGLPPLAPTDPVKEIPA